MRNCRQADGESSTHGSPAGQPDAQRAREARSQHRANRDSGSITGEISSWAGVEQHERADAAELGTRAPEQRHGDVGHRTFLHLQEAERRAHDRQR